ncbi:MFS transporter [Burkholderia gladioli]|uniref:MFS transporter n=1 Tax=Burkholderia gladioli TaxID=28095 RepID=A0A2A7SFH8_BURGA|nr:MFS transporter [Burkholderia gladioli]MBU9196812.1 MFS transporter [Burkholderia gladioli]MBU9382389.1 MFS transporter [Burkholderia gladioli]MBU9423358.1 MFS transporter [Burkholderia gladioli]MDN8059524.1 MFS transporter [Burkholderia gladioli]PEH42417.1 MFS transporter [Burkholderia gladioli]
MRLSSFSSPNAAVSGGPEQAGPVSRKRVLWLSCTAHALHDGYTDMIYALLPVWQADFGLNYGALAILRGIYAGTMATLQLPAGRIAAMLGTRATLVLGTLLAALGYAFAGMSGSLLGLCVALAISGSGSSTQHPLASGAVSRVYGRQARGPLSIYNFSGDLGKSALPAAISLLITFMPWRHALWAMSALGMVVALVIALWLPNVPRNAAPADEASSRHAEGSGSGFSLLFTIGMLDTAVRMGLLTFLPFLMKAKGISTPMMGTALALVFIGGAAGKFVCGWLGERMGVIGTVLSTEGGTALLILAVIYLPLAPAMILLPLLGAMLNGTSSVLYGTVPELTTVERTERAFAIFYTGIIAAGALAPVGYGLLGDRIGVVGATIATAATALAIFPLALALRPHLRAA